MKRFRCVMLTVSLALAAGLKAQDKLPLKLIGTISLPGLKDGDFDHFTPDLDGHRLFLTAEENGKVLVFAPHPHALVHSIEDLKAPHAILYRRDLNKLFIVDGDASAVKIYDSEN